MILALGGGIAGSKKGTADGPSGAGANVRSSVVLEKGGQAPLAFGPSGAAHKRSQSPVFEKNPRSSARRERRANSRG